MEQLQTWYAEAMEKKSGQSPEPLNLRLKSISDFLRFVLIQG